MGKYTDEPDVTVSKADLAKTQLEDAIDMFLAGRRVSATTLAGAADGIFEGLLRERGEKTPAEETWEHIVEVREKTGLPFAGTRSKKEAFVEWNQGRNRFKHHDGRDSDPLTVNVFDESYDAIQRANVSGDRLGIVADNRQEYENWLIENVYTL